MYREEANGWITGGLHHLTDNLRSNQSADCVDIPESVVQAIHRVSLIEHLRTLALLEPKRRQGWWGVLLIRPHNLYGVHAGTAGEVLHKAGKQVVAPEGVHPGTDIRPLI